MKLSSPRLLAVLCAVQGVFVATTALAQQRIALDTGRYLRLAPHLHGLFAQALGFLPRAGLQVLLEGLQVVLDVLAGLGGGHDARSSFKLGIRIGNPGSQRHRVVKVPAPQHKRGLASGEASI